MLSGRLAKLLVRNEPIEDKDLYLSYSKLTFADEKGWSLDWNDAEVDLERTVGGSGV